MPLKKRKIIKANAETTVPTYSPVIFCLKLKETIAKPATEEYSKIIEKEFTGHNMTNDLLLSVINKIEPTATYDQYVVCFWCCHTFTNQKCVLPVSYDSYKNIYTCEGNFCSPQCAIAYNYSNPLISDQTCWNRHALVGMLYGSTEISPAPPRSLLRMFGGVLSIEQYRNYLTTVNDLIFANLPPIRMINPVMNIQGNMRDVKKFVSLSNEVIENAEDGLRLKRNKPINPGVLTLDSLTAVAR
jgi:hypothetical protein